MSHFQVWAEGYQATGNSSRAQLLGSATAETFQGACDIVMRKDGLREYYDPKRLSFWGCRLFDNEADARSAFG